MARNSALTQPQRVTLREVARAAGLSESTVSLALNRRADCHLSEATRRRAIEVANQLGYRPNWRARALAKQQTFTIGLVYARQAPFMTAVNEAIATALAETFDAAGYHPLLVSTVSDPEGWKDVIRADRLDGCVVLNPMPVQIGQILRETRLPMVLANLLSDLPVPQVVADDHGGMQQLMTHLLDLGHRNIAFVYRAKHPHYSALHRRETYEHMMQQAGLGDRIRVVNNEIIDPFVDQYVAGNERATAVVCHDHVLAVELLHACWRRNIRVPQDVSIAAFNDVFPMSLTNPPLTAVDLPGDQLGRLSAKLLLEQIDNKGKNSGDLALAPDRRWLSERLVVRESTAAPKPN